MTLTPWYEFKVPFILFSGVCIKCHGETYETYAIETGDIHCYCLECDNTYVYEKNGTYFYYRISDKLKPFKYTVNNDGTVNFTP